MKCIRFDPNADVVAHVGGFIAGAILGCAMGHAHPATLQRGWINVAKPGVPRRVIFDNAGGLAYWRASLVQFVATAADVNLKRATSSKIKQVGPSIRNSSRL